MAAERIHRAGVNEGFEDALVADPQIDSLAEVEERAERTILRACTDDGIDRGSSDIANTAEPKTNTGVADDSELVARLVDIRRQNLEARFFCPGHMELARLIDVLDDVV